MLVKKGMWRAKKPLGSESVAVAGRRCRYKGYVVCNVVLFGADPKGFACKLGPWLARDAGKIGYVEGEKTFRV
jgi:hypothetical protein